MTRDEQEQRRRDFWGLCQRQYRGGDNPTFLNARCKKQEGHREAEHTTWRGMPPRRRYFNWKD